MRALGQTHQLPNAQSGRLDWQNKYEIIGPLFRRHKIKRSIDTMQEQEWAPNRKQYDINTTGQSTKLSKATHRRRHPPHYLIRVLKHWLQHSHNKFAIRKRRFECESNWMGKAHINGQFHQQVQDMRNWILLVNQSSVFCNRHGVFNCWAQLKKKEFLYSAAIRASQGSSRLVSCFRNAFEQRLQSDAANEHHHKQPG